MQVSFRTFSETPLRDHSIEQHDSGMSRDWCINPSDSNKLEWVVQKPSSWVCVWLSGYDRNDETTMDRVDDAPSGVRSICLVLRIENLDRTSSNDRNSQNASLVRPRKNSDTNASVCQRAEFVGSVCLALLGNST
jgi:hypothetical protein